MFKKILILENKFCHYMIKKTVHVKKTVQTMPK